MSISRLTLQNFRNYAELRLDTGSGFVVLSGDNGAGKTNILEAVSLLAPGRGLRRAALSEMARDRGPGGFAIAAGVADIQLGTGVTADQPDRRKTRINGANAATNDLAQWLSILWLTPAMDRLFIEGAAGRRNFLDRLITALEPGHARACSRYETARRERNRLLASDQPPDPDWLDALEAQLAEHGAAIAENRRRIIAALNGRMDSSRDQAFARAHLALDRETAQTAEDFQQLLRNNRQADRRAGRTLVGPHRADLLVSHVTKQQTASRCSTGEQKALLFSIILAQAELVADARDQRPILLLDEVAAHLDPRRRAALFDRLADSGGQVWLTGTEPQLFTDIPSSADHFRVADGTIDRR